MVLILYFIFCICAGIAISRRQLSRTKATAFERRWIEIFMAFDEGHGRCVEHNKLWKILKEIGIPDHLACLMRNLYLGQKATTKTRHGTTDWFKIGKGVRQGCILYAYLTSMQSTTCEMQGWMKNKLEDCREKYQ